MKYISYTILFMSVSGAASAAVSLLLCRALQKQLTHRARYTIWIAVLFMFLMPNFSNTRIYRNNTIIPADNAFTAVVEDVTPQMQQGNTVSPDVAPANNTILPPQPIHRFTPPNPKTVKKLLLLVWLTVAAALFIKKRIQNTITRKKLSRITEAAPEEIVSIFSACKNELNLTQNVSLYTVCADCSPFITGIVRPKVVIPQSLPKDSMKLVFTHELTHCKRFDLLFSLLCEIICILHWFNPLVWIADKERHKEMEFSCDEAVAARLSSDERHAYIVSILSIMRQNHTFASSAFLSENGMNIKKRIDVIMNKRKNSLISGLLAATMLVCSAVTSYAIGSQNPETGTYSRYETLCSASFSYTRGCTQEEYGIDDDTGGAYRVPWEISLNEIKKEFSASASINEYRLDNGARSPGMPDTDVIISGAASKEKNTKHADIKIDMTEFTESYADGSIWKGKFTVNINGNTVAENADGFIENIPTADYKDYAVLSISVPDENKAIALDNINFNLTGTDVIDNKANDSAYAKKLYESNTPHKYRITSAKGRTLGNEYNLTAEDKDVILEGRLSLDAALEIASFSLAIGTNEDDYTYTTIPKRYIGSFSENQFGGQFLLFRKSSSLADCKNATITIDGENAIFKSDDGSVDIVFTIEYLENDSADYNYRVRELSGFPGFSRTIMQNVSLDKLPFTMRLTDAGIQIAFKDEPHYRWQQAIATYSGENNMFETTDSVNGEYIYTFPLIKDGRRHYIYTILYDNEPYLKRTTYDLVFTVVNGELFFHNCSEDVNMNEDITGDDAIPVLNDNILFRN